jgi:hypothetical protein
VIGQQVTNPLNRSSLEAVVEGRAIAVDTRENRRLERTRATLDSTVHTMAAVGALMDDSYADRAKKATIASTLRNNAKQLLSQPTLEASGAPGAISSSTSDTLDSSPALSTSQTPATSLIMPNSVPMSSASSDQASPARPAPSLSPANVWSQQSPWKTPTKQPPASNLPTPITNFDKHNPPSELSPFSVRSELHPSSLKAASRPSQRNVDPFVVNYSLNAPSLADASNWPQVGESTAPQHRARPSASSTSSTIITSTPQAPMKPAYDTESELSPSKKAKGEYGTFTGIVSGFFPSLERFLLVPIDL